MIPSPAPTVPYIPDAQKTSIQNEMVEVSFGGGNGDLIQSATYDFDGYTYDIFRLAGNNGGFEIAATELFSDYDGSKDTIAIILFYKNAVAATSYGVQVRVVGDGGHVRFYRYNLQQWYQIASVVDFTDQLQITTAGYANTGVMFVQNANGNCCGGVSDDQDRKSPAQIIGNGIHNEACGTNNRSSTTVFGTSDKLRTVLADFAAAGDYTLNHNSDGVLIQRASASVVFEKAIYIRMKGPR